MSSGLMSEGYAFVTVPGCGPPGWGQLLGRCSGTNKSPSAVVTATLSSAPRPSEPAPQSGSDGRTRPPHVRLCMVLLAAPGVVVW